MAQAIGIWNGNAMARKANGQGYTYKNGSSFRTIIKHNGFVVTAMARTAQESRQKAKDKLQIKIGELETEQAKNLSNLLLENYLMSWLEDEHKHNIAHSTYKRYRSLATNHINPALGKYRITELSPRLINQLLVDMRKSGQSVRSIQQARALLSIALGEAENLSYITSNPVRKVKNPINSQKTISPLTLDEVKRLLKTYEGTYLCARLHIALICGLRQGEAIGLRWQGLDLAAGKLEVRKQIQIIEGKQEFTDLKTERSKRTVMLTESTLKALVEHQKIVERMREGCLANWQDLDLVFPRENGSPRSPQTDYDEWQKALKLCGIAPKRLHDARHTAATLMYSQSIGIETISRALGHSSSAITSRLYVHSVEEPLRKAATALNGILNIS
jgi:integrase